MAVKLIVTEKRATLHIGAVIVDLNESDFRDLAWIFREIDQRRRVTGRPSRCCGRCDGVHDECVTDMICDEHHKQGCEICWPHPQAAVTPALPRSKAMALFVLKHEEAIGNAILKDDEDLKKRIGELARKEVGYSQTTWSLDIFRTVHTAYERAIMRQ